MYHSDLVRHIARHHLKAQRYVYRTLSISAPPFEKLLIANRGEIACRIARTCRRLGIQTVAVYSQADGIGALHAQLADESYCIGTGPSAVESYLLGNEILRIAQESGAQAIHPAYGFLSENANFAQAVSDAGLTFIGPPPSAITAMGSKSHSKTLMENAGVPTTPGYHGSNQDPEYLLHQAVANIGFPLLIKAVMGGGGKGMRLVWEESEFLEALKSCQRESLASFGDASVLLERYLLHPRHVEVQVMADRHGNVVHLNERDCSLQRRHQKIIEEAPASSLDQTVRLKLGDMGTKAALAVNYVNAGTVEFLVDTQSSSNEFYFCEMNTRLQVEHPVTEMITGLDLVEWQLRIAAGEELPIKNQQDIPCQGHAFEARIYAENPLREFLPATGNVWHHRPPSDARVDTGIQSGQDITVYYDPMISKLIVHGEDRSSALEKLISALKRYELAGVPTNIDFLIKCAQHPVFQEPGACNTGFLEHYMDDILEQGKVTPIPMLYAVAAFCRMLYMEKRAGVQNLPKSRLSKGNPWSSWSGSWRAGGQATRVLQVAGDDCKVECCSNADGSFNICVEQSANTKDWFHIDGTLDKDGSMSLLVNGSKRVAFSSFLKEFEGDMEVYLWSKHQWDDHYFAKIRFHDLLASNVNNAEGAANSLGTIAAPMPGKIVRINAQIGDMVKKDDVLIIMEAMKMQHSIRSPRDGLLVDIFCVEDSIVDDGHVLATVTAILEDVAAE